MPSALLSRLRSHAKPAVAQSTVRFFKEDVKPIGLYIPQVRTLIKEFVKEKPRPASTQSEIRSLWASGQLEARTGAIFLVQFSNLPAQQKLDWAMRFLKDSDLNWALSDAISGCLLGPLIIDDQKFLAPTRALLGGNRWEARACIVALIMPMRRGIVSVDEVLAQVRVHLFDEWHYSQKACGWVMRECYKKDAMMTKRFMAAQKNMPRVCFSYACERMGAKEKMELKKKVYVQ